MEWQNQGEEGYLQYPVQNGAIGKVMTDEQVEELRKQIVAYKVISEQLAEKHRAMCAHQDFTGKGNPYCDPIMASIGHKMSARQRWSPTTAQLQILESIYHRGNGTPSKQKIKEITAQLAQHGQISETNVYNWFQNRRARSKRKFQGSAAINKEPEADAQGLAVKDKRTKPETMNYIDTTESFYFQNSETGIDQLIGKVDYAGGYDPYNDI
ncbi:hypothetical protein PTKIN_Ptkin13bG0033200 [Pterospermum kingtungense]